jgi:hypothetical protein
MQECLEDKMDSLQATTIATRLQPAQMGDNVQYCAVSSSSGKGLWHLSTDDPVKCGSCFLSSVSAVQTTTG